MAQTDDGAYLARRESVWQLTYEVQSEMWQKRDIDGCAGDEQSSHQPFWYRCSVCKIRLYDQLYLLFLNDLLVVVEHIT